MRTVSLIAAIFSRTLFVTASAFGQSVSIYGSTSEDDNGRPVKATLRIVSKGNSGHGTFITEKGAKGLLSGVNHSAKTAVGIWKSGKDAGNFELSTTDNWKTFSGHYYVSGENPPGARSWRGCLTGP